MTLTHTIRVFANARSDSALGRGHTAGDSSASAQGADFAPAITVREHSYMGDAYLPKGSTIEGLKKLDFIRLLVTTGFKGKSKLDHWQATTRLLAQRKIFTSRAWPAEEAAKHVDLAATQPTIPPFGAWITPTTPCSRLRAANS